MRKPSQADVLRLGPEVATIKASLPRKRWRAFVKDAHKKGYTVAGALSPAPGPLKERTNKSLQKQAESTVATAYKPVMAELSRQEAAAGFLAKKRADDDSAYRTWMMGEVDKLDAQARAADTALITQQSDIATDLNTKTAAANADSLLRAGQQAGNVSNPNQSTALDQTAADDRSKGRVADAREHTAALMKVGADANQISRAALIATAAVREATRTAEGWKTIAGINTARTQATHEQAKDSAGLLQQLREGNANNAKAGAELELAAGSLGVKQQDIVAKARAAARTYQLDTKKFNLTKWKARNADEVARLKVKLGYDEIEAKDGKAAADRALDVRIQKMKSRDNAKDRAAKGGKDGVSMDERSLYRMVEDARGMIVRMRRAGVPSEKIRGKLLNLKGGGFDNLVIDVGFDLAAGGNMGVLSDAARAKAKRIGITHTRYFWD